MLRHSLLTQNKSQLNKIFLVNEGIENLLIKNALKYDNYEDFIDNSVSYRYTRSRINRVCLHILNNVTKQDFKALNAKLNYIRVLGFNSKGQKYLRNIKNKSIITTQFKNIDPKQKEIEWKAALLYSSLLNKPNDYIKLELKGPIITK